MIDLRSDTVTKPTPGMRSAIANADVGDDVYGEDPTVNHLEQVAANLMRTKKALFCSSGTQANLLALLSHCERGDECIVGQSAHIHRFEGGGAAALASVHFQPIDFEPDGTLDAMKVAAAVKPDDVHFAPTKLVCLEDTQDGRCLPLDYIGDMRTLVIDCRLGLHLDGARIFNAAVRQKISVGEIASHFDSVSFCLSKGLGTPAGSLLCGSTELISRARRWRKALGGGMRQAGILAAAGLYALEHNVERLAEDHDNAIRLGRGLANIEEISVDADSIQTNMVFVDLTDVERPDLEDFLKKCGIVIRATENTRLVTHLDIRAEDVKAVVRAFKDYFSRKQTNSG
jgi:threonine aldolase